MAKRAAIYLRMSSDRSGDEAGVKRQGEDAARLAAARDLSIRETCADNDTSAAGRSRRPGFERLLVLIEADEVDAVVAWSLDRLTRNRRDTVRLIEACQQHKVMIMLVRGADLDMTTPGGRLMADLFASIARNEIEVKSDRQRRANRQRAEAGLAHVARRAYGYEPNGMQIRESEAKVVRDMIAKFLGGWSFREIAQHLNAEGEVSTEGKQFTSTVVKDHITSKRNAGIRFYEGQDYDAVWEPIIDRATHERVTSEAMNRTAKYPNQATARSYLLTGLIYCGRCQQTMTGHQRKDPRSEVARRKYECPNYPHGTWCGNNVRLAAPVEYLVKEAVLHRLDTPGLVSLLAAADAPDASELRRLHDDQARLSGRLNALVDDYTDGTLNKSQFLRAKSRVEAELEERNSQLASSYASQKASGILNVMSDLRAAWDREADGWRRQLLGLVVSKIVVHPSRRRPWFYVDEQRYRFDPDAVEICWAA